MDKTLDPMTRYGTTHNGSNLKAVDRMALERPECVSVRAQLLGTGRRHWKKPHRFVCHGMREGHWMCGLPLPTDRKQQYDPTNRTSRPAPESLQLLLKLAGLAFPTLPHPGDNVLRSQSLPDATVSSSSSSSSSSSAPPTCADGYGQLRLAFLRARRKNDDAAGPFDGRRLPLVPDGRVFLRCSCTRREA